MAPQTPLMAQRYRISEAWSLDTHKELKAPSTRYVYFKYPRERVSCVQGYEVAKAFDSDSSTWWESQKYSVGWIGQRYTTARV